MQSETGKKSTSALSGGQKRFLRSLGHHLQPVVYLGKEGLSENLARTARDAFKTRELIKVKIGQNCALADTEAADWLAAATGAAIVQLIGRTILLYLPNKKLKPEQRISLPKAA
jgi:RNA-binding protein